jgi:uncharacterized protein
MASAVSELTKIRSPQKYFAAFFLVLLLALVVAAILSPAIQALLSPFELLPLHRIYNRLAMVCLLVITIWLLRHNGLLRRDVLGFATPWRRFLVRWWVGLAVGLAVMALACAPIFLLDVRILKPGAPDTATQWISLLFEGLLRGLSVALVEETFFRGAVQGAMAKQGSVRSPLFVVPLLYAAIHFFGEAVRIPADQVVATSGFVIFAGFFEKFRDPALIAEAFLALYCVGVLLALIRHRWGDIAGCLGLHAGFVAIVTMVRRTSTADSASNWSFLVSPFDGFLGLWVALIAVVACIFVWKFRR